MSDSTSDTINNITSGKKSDKNSDMSNDDESKLEYYSKVIVSIFTFSLLIIGGSVLIMYIIRIGPFK